MTLEERLDRLTSAIENLTKAMVSKVADAPAAAAEAPVTEEAPKGKKAAGKKAAAKTQPKVDEFDDLDDLDVTSSNSSNSADDDLGLDLDDEPEEAVDEKTLKQALSALGKSKGRETMLGIFKKYKASTFADLKEADYAKIYAEVNKMLG